MEVENPKPSTKKLSSLQKLAQSAGVAIPQPRRRSSLETSFEVGRDEAHVRRRNNKNDSKKPSQRHSASNVNGFSASGHCEIGGGSSAVSNGRTERSSSTRFRQHNFEVGGSIRVHTGERIGSENGDVRSMDIHESPNQSSSTVMDVDDHPPRRRSAPQQYQYSIPSGFDPPPAPTFTHVNPPSSLGQTSYTIGGNATELTSDSSSGVEKMEGVEDHGEKTPLVVLDGANVAHAYYNVQQGLHSKKDSKSEPDARGLQVAVDYFQSAGIRILVVLPQYWFRSKPNAGSKSSSWNDKMTSHPEQVAILNNLEKKGLIVASPPADDDDAYALTIARREESRSVQKRRGEGPGFCLSNDMFRDAQARDTTGALGDWLNKGRDGSVGPGRVSFSFADMGTMNDHGERVLDFVPNPRHPLIIWMDGM